MDGSVALESRPIERTQDARPGEWALLGGLSFVVFAAHMAVSGRYGYFIDELYYLACSHHLAWGYVDQPPLIAVIAWLVRVTLGDSLPALHFLPAVAAGLRVLLTGLITRELGARRFGMALACVCVMMAPIYLGLDSLLTMNAFESLYWMSAALIALKIFHGASPKLWFLFGVLCGVGLLNKHSMLFFWIWIICWFGSDEAAAAIYVAMDLAWRIDRFPYFSAESGVGNSSRISYG
jgi:Dolichyl-phosphate-mannose-protein mannosyltransferase